VTKRHFDWWKTNAGVPMISIGGAAPVPREDVPLPDHCKPATTIPEPNRNNQIDGLTAPARQRMAERRARSVNVSGPAFRRHV
jgi:hypothetical protein